MDQDRQQMEELVTELVQHQADVEPFMARHTADTVVVNIAGRRVLGAASLRDAMQAALASPLADVTTTVDVDDVRWLRPDVALVSFPKRVHDARPEGAPLPTTGALSYVVVRDDGTWRVALAQTTPVVGA